MKITSIVRQIKRTDQYSIFVDGKYAFSLSDSALLDAKIARGQKLSQAELTELQRRSDDDKLYNQTLRFVALRPRTRSEVEGYLARKHSPAPLIEQITNKLIVIGLVDDTRYAQAYVNDRRLLRPTSRRKMIIELRRKHVAKEVAEEIVGSSQEDERAALSAIITRKRRQTAYRDNRALMQYLSRQGFNYDDIKAVMNDDSDADY